jgi:hypothetical protein
MSILSKTRNFAEKKIKDLKTTLLVDVRYPERWIGSKLEGKDRILFENVKQLIDRYLSIYINQSLLVEINDFILKNICVSRSSYVILNELMKYLRIKLLSNNTDIIQHVMILLDFLVKNSVDYKVHLFIGQRKMMKTISVVGRRQRNKPSFTGYGHQETADIIFDCIQAWGEAFYSRREVYPHIWATYAKLRHQYHIRFPRPYFDPTRVPIFLGPLDCQSYDEIARYSAVMGSYAVDDDQGDADDDDATFIDWMHDQEDNDISTNQQQSIETTEETLIEFDNLSFIDETKVDEAMVATATTSLATGPLLDLLTDDYPLTTSSKSISHDLLSLDNLSTINYPRPPSAMMAPAPAPARAAASVPIGYDLLVPYESSYAQMNQASIYQSAPNVAMSSYRVIESTVPVSLLGYAVPRDLQSASDRSANFDFGNQPKPSNSFDSILSDSVTNMKESLSKTSATAARKDRISSAAKSVTSRSQPTVTTQPQLLDMDGLSTASSTVHESATTSLAPAKQSYPSPQVSRDPLLMPQVKHEAEDGPPSFPPPPLPPAKPTRKAPSYMPPTSYADVQVRYYGVQRVAISKK